jgi:hypothetical protein
MTSEKLFLLPGRSSLDQRRSPLLSEASQAQSREKSAFASIRILFFA